MRVKLYYKIFAAFLLTSIMVVVLMIGIMRFYVARNFTDFVHKDALERLDNLTIELSNEYQLNGWQRLKNDPNIWRQILRTALPRKEFDRIRPPHRPDGIYRGIPPNPPGFNENLPKTEIRGRRSLPPEVFLRRGLILFDAHKQYLAGRQIETGMHDYSLREIAVNGEIVGWLGLPKRELLSHPRVEQFLKQQTRVFWLIGAGILLLAAAVAFILSKHLLAPIKQLTDGTRALAARKFETRIQVRTKDELGQLADDFNHMAETLKKYEVSRQQWITDISHELRTPIAILKGEIEALQDGVRVLDDHALDSLKAEVAHINKLVEDLHLLSRADTRSLNSKKDPVDPLVVLKSAVDAFRHRLNGKSIDIHLELADEKKIIPGDTDWLTRLFFNLFENTLKYTDSPGKLVVRSACTDKQLAISFEDSGPGVPEYALPRLFDRLYRVEQSRSRSSGGSGLGLSICKEIVACHSGEIQATKSALGGLLITIKFPLNGFV